MDRPCRAQINKPAAAVLGKQNGVGVDGYDQDESCDQERKSRSRGRLMIFGVRIRFFAVAAAASSSSVGLSNAASEESHVSKQTKTKQTRV